MKHWGISTVILLVILIAVVIVFIVLRDGDGNGEGVVSAGDDGVIVDPQVSCENSGGTWEDFDDSCANTCSSLVFFTPCEVVTTPSCNCGLDSCWNDLSNFECILLDDFTYQRS